jgi:hypothetical protein
LMYIHRLRVEEHRLIFVLPPIKMGFQFRNRGTRLETIPRVLITVELSKRAISYFGVEIPISHQLRGLSY